MHPKLFGLALFLALAAGAHARPAQKGRQDGGWPQPPQNSQQRPDERNRQDERQRQDGQHGPDDRNRQSHALRQINLNMFCRFEPIGAPPVRCYAGALIPKTVSKNGEEVLDQSEYPNNPVFEVECAETLIFNDPGRRFTDEQGTRIQAQGGPYPAVVLPPGALREGHRKVKAQLELREATLDGICHLYPGIR